MYPHWCAHERRFKQHCLWPGMRRTALAPNRYARGATEPADLVDVGRRRHLAAQRRPTGDEPEDQNRIERLRRSHVGYCHDLFSIGPPRCAQACGISLLEFAGSLKDSGCPTKAVAICTCRKPRVQSWAALGVTLA